MSFDVVSLYTNIDTEEAINTALEYSNKYNISLCGLRTEDMWEMFHLSLDDVFFYEDMGFYKQIRGLALGNRLNGTLTIVCMDRFERLFRYQELQPKPIVYIRYVDDVGITVNKSGSGTNALAFESKAQNNLI